MARTPKTPADRSERLRSFKPSSDGYGHIRRLAELGAVNDDTLRMINAVYAEVAAARFQLAASRLEEAKALMPTFPLAAHSAAYYAMYHAARAALLSVTKQDTDAKGDVEARVGKLLGGRFPELLADQRRRRNIAEYDPFPDLEKDQDDAVRCLGLAEKFVSACENRMKKR